MSFSSSVSTHPTVTFTPADYEAFLCFKASSQPLTSTTVVEQTGNHVACISQSSLGPWVIDSGASDHLCDSSGSSASQAEKEEVDSRSIYVGNVDYACTPEEIRQHFQACGTVNRVTILADKYGQPKGFAYVEFVEIDAVQNALLLNESELHGRKLKVSAKRTNIPGMKQYRVRRPVGLRSRRPFMPSPSYSPYGHGRVPRFRRPMRYRPY